MNYPGAKKLGCSIKQKKGIYVRHIFKNRKKIPKNSFIFFTNSVSKPWVSLTFKLCCFYICDRTKLWNHSFINNATSWWSICQSITYVLVLVNENLFLQICGNVIRTLILHICSKDRGITRITNTIRMVLVCMYYVC